MPLKSLIPILCLFVLTNCANWAVLVAGSQGFSNYRHQSDVFHSYQTLLRKGVSKDNIILMAYDDIAHNVYNYHFPGKVFNKPSYKEPGVDVYEGVVIDYKGANVNPTMFKNVLLGNKSAVAGKGSGRVLESTANDNVFIYFCDHGAAGLIAFPNHYLYANQLIQTLSSMHGHYSKLVFYLESCESGSMFINLPTNTSIYAISAAGADESSYGTYCSPDDVVAGKHIGSCLGDLFSISWMEDTDSNDVYKETLDEQFRKVRIQTNKSKVMQWGDLTFKADVIGDFVGKDKQFRGWLQEMVEGTYDPSNSMKPYYMKINFLSGLYKREPTAENHMLLLEQMASMHKFDNLFFALKSRLQLTNKYNAATIDFDCHKASIDFIEQKCGKLSEYSYQYIRLLAENCEKREWWTIIPAVEQICI